MGQGSAPADSASQVVVDESHQIKKRKAELYQLQKMYIFPKLNVYTKDLSLRN